MIEIMDTITLIKANLRTKFMGRELHVLSETTSTQDIAKELAEKKRPEGTAVIAERQKAGRGRLGRSWFSPQGGLAVSIVLYPALPVLNLLPAISSLAVLNTLEKFEIKSSIKWPNDVLIGGKKVCGILIENSIDAGHLKYTILGIGLNINFDVARFPQIAEIATSMSLILGRTVPIGLVATHLFSELEDLYLRSSEVDEILKQWAGNMDTIGQRIRVSTGNEIIEGTAMSISETGNLVIQLNDGTLREILAGDVTILKK